LNIVSGHLQFLPYFKDFFAVPLAHFFAQLQAEIASKSRPS